MRKKKLTHLMEPSFRLYFAFFILFAVVTALFSIPVSVIQLAVLTFVYLPSRLNNAMRPQDILK